MSFSSDIARYARRTNLTINDAVVSICAQATTAIIKRTPVDTGRARGNWYATVDTTTSETSESRTESEAIADAHNKAKNAAGRIFHLTNNLDYIYKLEYMHGSSQAPEGMLVLTAAEIERKLKALR